MCYRFQTNLKVWLHNKIVQGKTNFTTTITTTTTTTTVATTATAAISSSNISSTSRLHIPVCKAEEISDSTKI
jgi:hypothetical protein